MREDYQSDALALAALENDSWSLWYVAKRNGTVYASSTPSELLKLVRREYHRKQKEGD